MIYEEYTGDDAAHDMIKNEQFMDQKYQKAVSYEYGIGVDADLPRAIKTYELVALRGHPQSNLKLGMFYFHGHGVTQDINKAIKYLGSAGGHGCALSCFTLGWIYDEGILIPKDDDKAEYWYAKSAEKGNGNAQYNLSQLCLNISQKTSGNGYEKKSIEWLKLAVKNGHPLAQFKLGVMLFNKNDGFKSDVEAHELFKLSASQGNIDALYWLGLMYLSGHGVELDIKVALELLNKAKDAGHIQANIKIGDLYCNVYSGLFDYESTCSDDGNVIYDDCIEGNYEGKISFEHYLDAAKKGSAEAQYKTSLRLLFNDFDCKQGINWLKTAGDNNYPEAKYLLAIKEINSAPISKDLLDYISDYLGSISTNHFKKASFLLARLYWNAYRVGNVEIEKHAVPRFLMEWVGDIHLINYVEVPAPSSNKSTQELLSLAQSDDCKAQFILGNRYANGETVSRDEEKAKFWYEKSLMKGDPEVVCHLAHIYQCGIGVKRDIQKCYEILRSCRVEYISIYASEIDYRLGIVSRAQVDAVEHLEKAANYGHHGAKFRLAKLYLSDENKYLDAIKMLIGIASENTSEVSDCSLLALANEYFNNSIYGKRESINEEYIAPLLDERLCLDIGFKQEICEEMIFLHRLNPYTNTFTKYQQ